MDQLRYFLVTYLSEVGKQISLGPMQAKCCMSVCHPKPNKLLGHPAFSLLIASCLNRLFLCYLFARKVLVCLSSPDSFSHSNFCFCLDFFLFQVADLTKKYFFEAFFVEKGIKFQAKENCFSTFLFQSLKLKIRRKNIFVSLSV